MHSTQDTLTFIKEVEEVIDYNNFLVSFDVSSLFTSIPLNEIIELALDYILLNNPDVNICRKDLKNLFSETHFYFNGNIHEQIDGVVMGSPLGTVFANLIMGLHKHWLVRGGALSVLFYKRYIDDIFCMLKTSGQWDKFLDFLNNRHKSIKFTINEKQDQMLPFLYVPITNKKSTDTWLLTNYLSFISTRYKLDLVKH